MKLTTQLRTLAALTHEGIATRAVVAAAGERALIMQRPEHRLAQRQQLTQLLMLFQCMMTMRTVSITSERWYNRMGISAATKHSSR